MSITFAVFDVCVCISFMCLHVHVDLIQPVAARNNKRCCYHSGGPRSRCVVVLGQ